MKPHIKLLWRWWSKAIISIENVPYYPGEKYYFCPECYSNRYQEVFGESTMTPADLKKLRLAWGRLRQLMRKPK